MESGRAEVGAGTVVPEAKRRRRSIAERHWKFLRVVERRSRTLADLIGAEDGAGD
jgi:hypothetical protein